MSTPIEDVSILKAERAFPVTATPSPVSGKVLVLVAQGVKQISLGGRVCEYSAGQYIVASDYLPMTSQFTEASPEVPGLGVQLILRPSTVLDVLFRAGIDDLPDVGNGPSADPSVSTASVELLDAVIRLVRLLDQPHDIAVLAPLIKREIVWRLINGDQAAMVRRFGPLDGSLRHITPAVRWICDHYAEPVRVEDLAQLAGMSVSAFHRNFQAVIGMSPIQLQKQIRLQNARVLLAENPKHISGISRRVGYESPSQFSREYRRRFGLPPSEDVARLNGLADSATPSLPLSDPINACVSDQMTKGSADGD